MADAKVNDTVIEQPIVELDPWSVKRTVYILPEGYGEVKTLYFAVNGVGMDLKVGEQVEVPEPIAKRVDIYNDAIKARQKMYKHLREETARNARFL